MPAMHPARNAVDPIAARWPVYWLVAVGGLHVVIGIGMPWLLDLPPGRDYLDHLSRTFTVPASPGPDAPAAQLASWLIVLLGAMIAGWGVLIAGLALAAQADRSRRPVDVLLVALLVWVVLDIFWAVRAGVLLHVAIDALAMAAILPPLLWLRAQLPPRAANG